MGSQRGQATVEWTALVLVAALALGGIALVVPVGGGRSLAEALARALVCAVRGGCAAPDPGDAGLAAAYGARDAALVRRYAPNIAYEPGTYGLPIDWRRCRRNSCADAPYGDRDVARSRRGLPATAFTHLVRRGGKTYIQYWFYYPDSNTSWAGASDVWALVASRRSYPGFHLDDWEGYQVRIDGSGRATVRATAHHGYQYCKGPSGRCVDRWGPWTGWTRVSRGSHAGHIPMETHRVRSGIRHGPHYWRAVNTPAREHVHVHERTTRGRELRLVPLESVDPRSYHALQRGGPSPPWAKAVYRDPASDSTG